MKQPRIPLSLLVAAVLGLVALVAFAGLVTSRKVYMADIDNGLMWERHWFGVQTSASSLTSRDPSNGSVRHTPETESLRARPLTRPSSHHPAPAQAALPR